MARSVEFFRVAFRKDLAIVEAGFSDVYKQCFKGNDSRVSKKRIAEPWGRLLP